MRHKRLLIHLTVLSINWQINNLHARIEDLIRDPEKVEIASEMYEDIIKEDWRIARKIKRLEAKLKQINEGNWPRDRHWPTTLWNRPRSQEVGPPMDAPVTWRAPDEEGSGQSLDGTPFKEHICPAFCPAYIHSNAAKRKISISPPARISEQIPPPCTISSPNDHPQRICSTAEPNSPIQLPEDLQDASQELAVRVLSPDSGNILRLLNPQEAEVVFQFFDLLRMLDDLGDGIINHVNRLLPQDRQMPRGCFLELYHQFADAESSIPKHSPMSTHPWERMRKLMEIYRQAREASYHHISCGPERNNDPTMICVDSWEAPQHGSGPCSSKLIGTVQWSFRKEVPLLERMSAHHKPSPIPNICSVIFGRIKEDSEDQYGQQDLVSSWAQVNHR
ncbi:MAG: hypothetical protein Q9223_001092 [Gallowayella weberi]